MLTQYVADVTVVAASYAGMVGMTAYWSMQRIAKPKQGEVAYVSGAAGIKRGRDAMCLCSSCLGQQPSGSTAGKGASLKPYVPLDVGAVGTLVGQLLKNVYGCKVVGSAGSDDKVGTAQCFCTSS